MGHQAPIALALKPRDDDARFLVMHGDGGAYLLTESAEAPDVGWGTVQAYVPKVTMFGADLDNLGFDGETAVWVAQADGKTNEVTLLVAAC